MNRTARRFLVIAALSLAALARPAVAGALHTRADCASLPADEKTACNHCVSRHAKHIYESDRKPGQRCVEAEPTAEPKKK